MQRKSRRHSSPKRDPSLNSKEKEKISKKLLKVHDKLLMPKKSQTQEPKSENKQEHGEKSLHEEGDRNAAVPAKRKKEAYPLKDMLKDDKALKNISDIEHQLAERIDKNHLESFGSTAEGEVRSPLFSQEKFNLYSVALDREKLKRSDIWPFDSPMDEGKYKSLGLSQEAARNPILDSFVSPHSITNEEEKSNTSRHSSADGKSKKMSANPSFLSPIVEADNDPSEKKIDIKSVFEKCRLEGRKPKNHDTIIIADEKKMNKEISPQTSVNSDKRIKHSTEGEFRDPSDKEKIKHLFSVLNIPHPQLQDTQERQETPETRETEIADIDLVDGSEKIKDLKNISPFASFFNKLNNPQAVKNMPLDKASNQFDIFSFPEPNKKDKNSKNVIKTSRTFIAPVNKSSKKKGKELSSKHSSHGKKSGKESSHRTSVIKVELKPRDFDIPAKITETINSIAHSIRTKESNSFEYIPKSELKDISTQRPSSATVYKESKETSTRHLKKSKKQVYEPHCSSKIGDDIVNMGEHSKFKVMLNEGKSSGREELSESVDVPKKESTDSRFKTIINLEKEAESPAEGDRADKMPTFRNDNYVGVHLISQGYTGPTENVVRFEEQPPQEGVEINNKEDRAIKRHLRELIFYLIFLTLVTLVVLGMASSSQFYFTDITAKLFMESPSYKISSETSENKPNIILGKTLSESVTIADFWQFAESAMIDLLYWKLWFAFDDPDTHVEKHDKSSVYENFLLGVPRIRQVRVREDSCYIHADVSRFFDKCYDYYTIFSENTKYIKTGMEGSITKTAWEFASAEELGNSYYWGKISTYGGGGYYLDLSREQLKTVKMIEELKNNQWISRGTRAVFIDFTIYNANANLFCICKLVLEFPPMGGMIPQTDFRAVKLIRYLNKWDYFILGCEFVLVLFVVYYTYQEVIDFKKEKINYFIHWWNYVDLIILGLCYTYVVLNILLFVQSRFLLKEIPNRIYEHISFTSIGYTQTQFNNVAAVLVFFAWVKLFKYLNFNKAMIELSGTLSRSMKDIFGFAVMFFTVFIAFAQLAYLLFGSQVKDYSNVWSSSMALLQTVLGEFEYKQIEEANRVLGPLFYIVFIFFIFFVLLNMFLAIINDAYMAVKSEVHVRTDQLHVLDYTKRAFLNLVGILCCGLDKKLESKKSKMKRQTYAELKETLKRAGFSDLEVEMFFTKYEIDINQLIEKGENKRIIEDLEFMRLDLTDDKEVSEMEALKKEIERLNNKISEMQRNLLPVIEKVDILLRR